MTNSLVVTMSTQLPNPLTPTVVVRGAPRQSILGDCYPESGYEGYTTRVVLSRHKRNIPQTPTLAFVHRRAHTHACRRRGFSLSYPPRHPSRSCGFYGGDGAIMADSLGLTTLSLIVRPVAILQCVANGLGSGKNGLWLARILREWVV